MKKYAVKELFDTVQGEGGRAGARSVFLRLAGCNAWTGRPQDRAKGAGACARWCDTDFFKGDPMSAQNILARLNLLWAMRPEHDPPLDQRWVVISGGEPGLQLDSELVAALDDAGWWVAVETNGSVENHALMEVDWLTVSPKRGLDVRPELVAEAEELKVVLPGVVPGEGAGWSDEDLGELAAMVTGPNTLLYVQPQDPIDPGFVNISHLHANVGHFLKDGTAFTGQAQYDRNVRRCLEFVRKSPRWRLSVQTHKLIGVP